ncbi:hypothetical protein EVAR_26621_1 [Eumeta japonica]|uniref:Histone-lysine N-methyltransferase SETMAR n=1 Tax=Eumeta variegata TaxID=151549 RepID=A0A4C1XM07_EUMVA|nr:hypothetical protein EVAR_26621_1 [Eumeta japonica]
MLTPFDKQRRLQTMIFGVSRDNIDEICDRIVTVDETWHERQSYRSDGKLSRSAVLQDNASVHTARVSRQALKDTGF